jgi:hypothetical protein
MKEAPLVEQAVLPAPVVVRQGESRQALPVPDAPSLETEQPASIPAPAPPGTRVAESGGEGDLEPIAPPEVSPGKKAPKRAVSKKSSVPKKETKTAPKKAAAKKGAVGKAPPKTRE